MDKRSNTIIYITACSKHTDCPNVPGWKVQICKNYKCTGKMLKKQDDVDTSFNTDIHIYVYILYLFQTDYCSDMSPDFCKDHPYNDCRGPGFFHKCQKHCRGCIGKP